MIKRLLLALCVVLTCGLAWAKDMSKLPGLGGESKDSNTTSNKFENKSLTVTGDTVQYSPESRQFTASGSVKVEYKNAVLTCDSIDVDTSTKMAVAKGHARLDEDKGVIEGDKITYDFDKGAGLIENAKFRAAPYFGNTELLEKISDTHFLARRSKLSTCSFDHPHWFFLGKRLDIYPNEKLIIKDCLVYIKDVPLAYLPVFARRFQDPLVHVQVTPGSKKDWGKYVLSAWQYQVNDNISGKLYLDLRSRLGLAEGFGTNVKTSNYGKGDFKLYYSHENPEDLKNSNPSSFDRYFVRARQKWDIDPATNMVAEFYKIGDDKRRFLGGDNNVLKDYFPREYDKDAQPLTYVSLHKSFTHASMDFVVQKRVNTWYTQVEKLPEIDFNMPSLQIGESRLYLENISSFAALNNANAVPVPPNTDKSVNRLDTQNTLSYPMRVNIFNFTPHVGSRQTLYDKDLNGKTMLGSPRTIFSAGADVSTKFYRMFKVKTNAFGLHINDLRHVITPSVSYGYQHKPTIDSTRLLFESIPGPGNSATLTLSNKLQTKRQNQKVDVADLRITTPYNFHTGDGNKAKGGMGDILLEMDLIPYSWASFHSDLTYVHSGSKDETLNPNFGHISQLDYDFVFNLPHECSVGIGQRYQRKGDNELTTSATYKFNPKWKAIVLQRYLISTIPGRRRGMHEQQYTLVRDMHCWTSELTFSTDKDHGSSIYLVFRLKAFPELQVDFNKSYAAPKPGTQTTY